MHLPLVPAAAPRCETVATDARALYYNPAYIAGLTLTETQFVLAHEAMHCALGHFARRSHRVRRRWEIACDHAVNLLLVEEGLRPPEGVLANPDFKGLSAEEIYPLIPAEPVERTLDRHLFDEYGMDPRAGAVNRDGRAGEFGSSPSSDLPRDAVLEDSGELARRWQSRIVSAAQQARRAGRLAESWLRRVDGAIEPQLPWRALLARYLAGTARDDYSFQRPPRREGNALLPRLASGEVELCVTLDTSGSIGAEELAQFVSEVDAIKGQIRARVTLHACDERLDPRGPWEFQYWEPVTLPREIGGGGGTRFVPVFEWIESARRTPDVLLYFTDAEGEFPQHAPVFPVIWLVKGRGRVPWGARIQLN
jgi:predicted metal-dependent peptidase